MGCPMDALTMEETRAIAENAIRTKTPLHHGVVNVAKLVSMQSNPALQQNVARSDMVNIDGMGVVWGARLFGHKVPERVSGADIMEEMLKLCEEKGYKPYFLGARQKVLEKAIKNIQAEHPSLKIAGAQNGYFTQEDEAKVMKKIAASGADCLFIAITSPKKEHLLSAYKNSLNIPFIMGVGGSIDIKAGLTKRAPKGWQKRGLEWAYRLLQEPRRMFGRYTKTNTKYVFYLLKEAVDRARLHWLFHRLRAMGGREVLHRLKEHLLKSISARKTYAFPAVKGSLPALPLEDSQFEVIAKTCAPAWQKAAEDFKKDRFSALGKTVFLGQGGTRWHTDPVSEKTWPSETFCHHIPYRTAEVRDIKDVWEVARLQHLIPLAALSKYKDNQELKLLCKTEILSFIKHNPPYKGVHWSSGIELALRLISLMAVVSFIGEDSFSEAEKETLQSSLAAHGFWLYRYPSKYSSANNHLVAEAAGLYLLGTLAPHLGHAETWAAYGRQILIQEAEKQIYADGMGAEQSPTYTAFIIELFLLCRQVGEANKPFPKSLTTRLTAAAHALAALTDSAGHQPKIGDDDEGRVFKNDTEYEDHYPTNILHSLTTALGLPPLIQAPVTPHLRNLFLTRGQSLQASTSLPLPSSMSQHLHFPQGGLTTHRNTFGKTEGLMVMDHGPLGYLSIAAHGHADALSLWLHAGGHPVLIDTGTYLYTSGKQDRDHFRSTAAHNTLTIGGESQSIPAGPFNWSHQAKSHVVRQTQTSLSAAHTGYKKRFGLIHRRTLTLQTKGYNITDELHGKPRNPHLPVTARLHLHPALHITQKNPTTIHLTTPAGCQVVLQTSLPHTLTTAPWSPRFGVKSTCPCLQVDTSAAAMQAAPLVTTLTFPH